MTDSVTVEKVLSNGWGLAHLATGETLFVAGALPGERFKPGNLEKRKGTLWAAAPERLTDAAVRTPSPCPHFGECGGCSLLHVDRRAELTLKRDILLDVLKRVGHIVDPNLQLLDFPLETSRIRGKFHLSAGRLGFKLDGSARVTALNSCLVIPRSVSRTLPVLNAWLKGRRGKGELFFATNPHGENPVWEFRGKLADARALISILADQGAKGVSIDAGNGRRKWGAPRVAYVWNGVRVQLRPSHFFQNNPASWPVFFEWVRRYIEGHQPESVWDAHAGAGFLTSCLAGVGDVFCSEPQTLLRQQLAGAMKRAGRRVRVYAGTAEEALAAPEFSGPRGLILDPPRSGLSPVLKAWLRIKGPPSLLYFSCDMATFSRDLRELSPSYRMVSPILAMNLNPGTLRLETAVILQRAT